MAIAQTVLGYLQQYGVAYAVVAHPHTETSKSLASSAHVAPQELAKAVVLSDQQGYVMAVVPGDRHVDVRALSRRLRRKLHLAQEATIAPIFGDCCRGAIPPLGTAYGIETVLDNSLLDAAQVYFEAGDHEELIRVSGEDFQRLLRATRRGKFSH